VIVDPSGIGCVFCDSDVESSRHMFVTRDFVIQVLYNIFRWLG